LQVIEQALNVGNLKGAYSLTEANTIFIALNSLKNQVQVVAEAATKAAKIIVLNSR